jgi:hypothetical protein
VGPAPYLLTHLLLPSSHNRSDFSRKSRWEASVAPSLRRSPPHRVSSSAASCLLHTALSTAAKAKWRRCRHLSPWGHPPSLNYTGTPKAVCSSELKIVLLCCRKGARAAASRPPLRQGATASAASCPRQLQAGLLQRADTEAAMGASRRPLGCCKGQCRSCYGPSPMLQAAAAVATCHGCRCYMPPPTLLHAAAAFATYRRRRCYMRPPRFLHLAADVATCGRRGCYIPPPTLLLEAAALATSVHRCCYRKTLALLIWLPVLPHPVSDRCYKQCCGVTGVCLAGESTSQGSPWLLPSMTAAASRGLSGCYHQRRRLLQGASPVATWGIVGYYRRQRRLLQIASAFSGGSLWAPGVAALVAGVAANNEPVATRHGRRCCVRIFGGATGGGRPRWVYGAAGEQMSCV